MSEAKTRTKEDFMIKLRVFKNRLDMMGEMLIGEIEDFELHDIKRLPFRDLISIMHIGERNAFKDLILGYMAKSYMLGVYAGKKGEKNGLQDKDYLCEQKCED